MADIIDVQQALVALAAQAVYPNGTGQPSVANADVRVYPGWPQQSSLDSDLSSGKVNVSVFPTQIERNTTRYPRDNWQESAVNATTFTLSVSGQQITVGGAQPVTFYSHNLMVMAAGQPYVYVTQSADTLTSIATALAALIPGASNVGAVITVPNGTKINTTQVGAGGTQIREVRRQERVFTLTVWADTSAKRDLVAKAIDSVLAVTQFLTMPDGFLARLIYRNSMVTDEHQKAKLYRRDLSYSVEYATTETAVSTQITQVQVNTEVQPGGATSTVNI